MVKIEFLGFDDQDVNEMIGMALDAQFENIIKGIIGENMGKLPELIQDLTPAIAAWALRKYLGLDKGFVGDALKGIMKKNIAEVISARWLTKIGI